MPWLLIVILCLCGYAGYCVLTSPDGPFEEHDQRYRKNKKDEDIFFK